MLTVLPHPFQSDKCDGFQTFAAVTGRDAGTASPLGRAKPGVNGETAQHCQSPGRVTGKAALKVVSRRV